MRYESHPSVIMQSEAGIPLVATDSFVKVTRKKGPGRSPRRSWITTRRENGCMRGFSPGTPFLQCELWYFNFLLPFTLPLLLHDIACLYFYFSVYFTLSSLLPNISFTMTIRVYAINKFIPGTPEEESHLRNHVERAVNQNYEYIYNAIGAPRNFKWIVVYVFLFI